MQIALLVSLSATAFVLAAIAKYRPGTVPGSRKFWSFTGLLLLTAALMVVGSQKPSNLPTETVSAPSPVTAPQIEPTSESTFDPEYEAERMQRIKEIGQGKRALDINEPNARIINPPADCREGAGESYAVKLQLQDEWVLVNRGALQFDGEGRTWYRDNSLGCWIEQVHLSFEFAPDPSDSERKPETNPTPTPTAQPNAPVRSGVSGSCECPYDTDRAGRSCGGRSAYYRPNGRRPICYASDTAAPVPQPTATTAPSVKPTSEFNAEIFDPPSNCRTGAGSDFPVQQELQKGNVLVDTQATQSDGEGGKWYREVYLGCWIHGSQLRF